MKANLFMTMVVMVSSLAAKAEVIAMSISNEQSAAQELTPAQEIEQESARLSALTSAELYNEAFKYAPYLDIDDDDARDAYAKRVVQRGPHAFALYKHAYSEAIGTLKYTDDRTDLAAKVSSAASPLQFLETYLNAVRFSQYMGGESHNQVAFAEFIMSKPNPKRYLINFEAGYEKAGNSTLYRNERFEFAKANAEKWIRTRN